MGIFYDSYFGYPWLKSLWHMVILIFRKLTTTVYVFYCSTKKNVMLRSGSFARHCVHFIGVSQSVTSKSLLEGSKQNQRGRGLDCVEGGRGLRAWIHEEFLWCALQMRAGLLRQRNALQIFPIWLCFVNFGLYFFSQHITVVWTLRTGFDPGAVHVGFVVEKVALV